MIHHPRYVKSFLAIVGRGLPEAGVRIPEPLAALEHDIFNTFGVQVHSFGSSTATLDPAPRLGGPAWVKGRPFSLATSPGLAMLGEPATGPDAALLNLDGKWSLLLTRTDGSLLAATDLLGSGSIYYCESENRLYLSSHLGLLLGALPTAPAYHQDRLASLLATRRCLDDGTPWAGVARLPAGCYLAVAPPREAAPIWSIAEYGTITEALAGPARTADQAALVAEYDGLLRESLRRERYTGKTALMLSGGRDSPALALALLEEAGPPFTAVTFGSPGTKDVLGATALAQHLQIPHVRVPYEAWNFSTYADRIAALNGGLTSLEFSYQLPGYEFASADFDIAIVGHLGNLLTGFGRGTTWPLEQRWRRTTSPWGRPSQVVERFYPDESARVYCLYAEQAERTADLLPHHQSMVRIPMGTSWQSLNFDVAESYLELSYPFYYRPLLSFVFNLPHELFPATGLYEAWHKLAFEAASRVVGVRPPEGPHAGVAPAAHGEPSGTLRNRYDVVNWPSRIRRSAEWLFTTIDECCDDPRLRALCRSSLRSHLQGDGTFVPVVLMGLAPPLAKCLLGPRREGLSRWLYGPRPPGARMRKAWARVATALRPSGPAETVS